MQRAYIIIQPVFSFQKAPDTMSSNVYTALMEAARKGDMVALRQNMRQQARMKDNLGVTALMYAAQAGHYEAVSLLAEYEAGMQDWRGKTALITAIQNGHAEVARVLVPYEAGLRDTDGATALMSAAGMGFSGLVQELLEKEVKCVDDSGKTALMYAAESNQVDAVKALLKHEAGIRDASGQTAMMYATVSGNISVVELLLSYEAGVCKDNGWSCLMTAAKLGNFEAAELLAPKEACLAKQNGMTALMVAAQFDHEDIVRLLMVDEGNMVRKDGLSARNIASQFGNHEIADILASSTHLFRPINPSVTVGAPRNNNLPRTEHDASKPFTSSTLMPPQRHQYPHAASGHASHTPTTPITRGSAKREGYQGVAGYNTPALIENSHNNNTNNSHQDGSTSKLVESYILSEASQFDNITLNATMMDSVHSGHASSNNSKILKLITEIDYKDCEIDALKKQVTQLQNQLSRKADGLVDIKADYISQAKQLQKIAEYMLEFANEIEPGINYMNSNTTKKPDVQ